MTWIRGKLIGKGSYGTVNLGFRDGKTVPFAVKSANKSSVLSIKALENEINILNSISKSSPFIVDYYGEDETVSEKSLFMEYLPNGDVARGGRITDVDLIRSYTWCLIDALRAVHKNKIVHCDVKGSNVLLGATRGVAKLADFGSATRGGDGESNAPRGSPSWMAPEVVRGELQSYESDVWSIGCTVIEMFSGMPAWRDCGPHTLFKIGYSDDLPEYPPQVTELGRDFLDKCLVRDPLLRWTCDQLLQHPFLLPAPAGRILEISPRSVFDDDFNFAVENDDDDDDGSDEVLARGRIGNLATVTGVNWENDGWLEVRNEKSDTVLKYQSVSQTHYPRNNVVTLDDESAAEIHLSTENDEAESDGGVDGGSICRQDMRNEKNMTVVTTKFIIIIIILLITLYSSRSIGLIPNVIIIKLIQIHCVWIISSIYLILLRHANFREFYTLIIWISQVIKVIHI